MYCLAWFPSSLTSASAAGVISSNGEAGNSLAGGASGGSIILNTATLNGKGRITANGGPGEHTCTVVWINIAN